LYSRHSFIFGLLNSNLFDNQFIERIIAFLFEVFTCIILLVFVTDLRLRLR